MIFDLANLILVGALAVIGWLLRESIVSEQNTLQERLSELERDVQKKIPKLAARTTATTELLSEINELRSSPLRMPELSTQDERDSSHALGSLAPDEGFSWTLSRRREGMDVKRHPV